MQKEIDVQFQTAFEDVEELVIVELCLKEVVHWNLGTGSWNLNAASAGLKEEDSDLVAGYDDVDLVPVTVTVTLP
jgi:hypothetical protein